MSCTRRGVKTEHLVARTFFSVLRTFDHHTHLRVAQGLTAHVWDVLQFCALFLKVIHSHSMFHRPLLDVPDPFPSFCSTPPPSTPNSLLMTGICKHCTYLRTFRTSVHVTFSRVAQDMCHQVSSECLSLDRTTIFTSGTPCLTRSRCCSLT